MDETALKRSLCWECSNSESEARWTPSGQYFREWSCFMQHRHQYGHVKDREACQDFTERLE